MLLDFIYTTLIIKLKYFCNALVSERLESLGSLRRLDRLSGSSDLLGKSLLLGVVSSGLDLASLLQTGDDVLVFPANFVTQSANSGVLSAGLKSKNTEGLWNNNTLLTVIRRGNTLKDLQALHGSSTTSGLVGNHTTDSLVEDAGRSTEMERTVGLVEAGTLAEVGMVL